MLKELLNKLRGNAAEGQTVAESPALSPGEASRREREARVLVLRTEVRSIQRAIADASGSRDDGAPTSDSEQLDREIAELEVQLERTQRSLAGFQGRI